MSCFWRDLKGTAQTCHVPTGQFHGLGNIVYIGYDEANYPDDYAVFEVTKDMSAVLFHGYVTGFHPDWGYSKGGKYYGVDSSPASYSLDATFVRHQGGGAFATMATPTPTTWGYGARKEITVDGSVLRMGTSDLTPSPDRHYFFESTDGETWTEPLPYATNIVSGADSPTYIKFGARWIVGYRDPGSTGGSYFYYSDDDGSTWVRATGATYSGSNMEGVRFYQGGGGVVAIGSVGLIWRTTDGATWTQVAATNTGDDGRVLAANGTGGLVYIPGDLFDTGNNYDVVWYSTNHGASWTARNMAQTGFPDLNWCLGVFWTGTQYAAIGKRYDNGLTQMFTSPTGAVWTPSIVVPELDSAITQIIA